MSYAHGWNFRVMNIHNNDAVFADVWQQDGDAVQATSDPWGPNSYRRVATLVPDNDGVEGIWDCVMADANTGIITDSFEIVLTSDDPKRKPKVMQEYFAAKDFMDGIRAFPNVPDNEPLGTRWWSSKNKKHSVYTMWSNTKGGAPYKYLVIYSE